MNKRDEPVVVVEVVGEEVVALGVCTIDVVVCLSIEDFLFLNQSSFLFNSYTSRRFMHSIRHRIYTLYTISYTLYAVQ